MIPGAAEAIRQLTENFGPLYVISRVDNVQDSEEILVFLKEHGILDFIPIENIRFCLKRTDKQWIAADLKLTHFVDDRMEVLFHMKSVPNRFALNPVPEEVAQYPLDGIRIVHSWDEVLKAILSPPIRGWYIYETVGMIRTEVQECPACKGRMFYSPRLSYFCESCGLNIEADNDGKLKMVAAGTILNELDLRTAT